MRDRDREKGWEGNTFSVKVANIFMFLEKRREQRIWQTENEY